MNNVSIKKVFSLLTVLSLLWGIFGIPVVGEWEGDVAPAENVIYLIGDGMGYDHWKMCKQESGTDKLFIEDGFEYYGFAKTRSLTNAVTDSAAAGTALATGVRTYNGAIGVYLYNPLAIGSSPKNLCELAMEKGLMTGVVTSDSDDGATPSAFSSHSVARNMSLDLSMQHVESGIDLIWTASSGNITAETVKGTEYTLITNSDELDALPAGVKSIGQFNTELWARENDDNCPTLSELTVEAIDRLDDKDGFFLMVEGAHIDKHSHSNDAANMTEAMLEFDKTVKAAVDYAKADGNTIVIVTADHETGGIVYKDGKYSYTQGSHSATNVPVCVYGTDDFIAEGDTINNVDIPVFISKALGADEEAFPASVPSSFNFKYIIADLF